MITIFVALTLGIDNYFGPQIKVFCCVLYFIWIAQIVTNHWKEIKELIKVLYGLDKK